MIESVALGSKTYSYLMVNGEKFKETKKLKEPKNVQ